ncbi:hypothetical protein FPV67DRAFT_1500911 [Lyophyllum atratum]|nr:hypothetical protein FPV67DRAFT_1500911 [Lyophyllum atratum]
MYLTTAVVFSVATQAVSASSAPGLTISDTLPGTAHDASTRWTWPFQSKSSHAPPGDVVQAESCPVFPLSHHSMTRNHRLHHSRLTIPEVLPKLPLLRHRGFANSTIHAPVWSLFSLV